MKKVLEINNLKKVYGDFQAVNDLSLEVEEGEVFAFLGPNGAGKTTTIRILMGILQPTSGEAFIEGQHCFNNRAQVKRMVGYLPDEPVFYDYLRGNELLSFVGEMHGLSPHEIEAVTVPLIERLELADSLDEYAMNYSHGMKKKLALIFALIHDPNLLILDEPTNGLDPHSIRVVHELIQEKAKEGKSIFFSTHLLDQAEKLCDRIAILFKGELAKTGSLKELQESLVEGGNLEEIFFAVTQNAQTSSNLL